MKKTFLIPAMIAFLFFTSQMFGFEIHFTSPVNGQNFICGSDNTANVNFSWSQSGDYYPEPVYYFIKLFTEVGTYNNHSGPYPPSSFNLSGGVHSMRIELWQNYYGTETKMAEQSVSFNVKYTIYAANNFGGGSINLENSTVTSGSSVLKLIGESVAVGAIDQNDGAGYNRIWNSSGYNNSNWYIHGGQISQATPRNYSYTVTSNDNNATLIADLKKICNVTFQNTGHQITINGNNYSSSGTVQAVELNPVTVLTDSYYSSNGLDYNFSCWTDGTNYYSSPVSVSNHSSFTAKYIGTPNNSGKNFNFGPNFNQPIVINWIDVQDANASPYITYKIYRRVGDAGTPVLLSNVSPGVQTYTDNDYLRTTDVKKSRLFYDVREYYSVDGTYSPESWTLVYGDDNYKPKGNKAALSLAEEIPAEYKLDNFPNPFNPTTVINYQLPNDGFVTVKVYDMLGREIATLVNENKNAGYYKVSFDASRLTSGVYIYSIKANNFVLSKKMLLMK